MDTFHKVGFDVEPYLGHLLLEVVVGEEHCSPSSVQGSVGTAAAAAGTEQSDMNLSRLHQINHESCPHRPSRLRL